MDDVTNHRARRSLTNKIQEWLDKYVNFVMDAMTDTEFENLTKTNEPLLKALLQIIPPRVMDTHCVYPVGDIRFLVPRNVTLTEENRNTLARLASDPEKYEIANPVYVLQEIAKPNRLVIDDIGPIYAPQ
ncbi:MAG: hypothetical protein HDQ88_08760 [Clostridia bacterium]|nr:hypothetical protein [Clostridia bacterium]